MSKVRIYVLLLAGAICISLAGCTKQEQSQTESESPPAVSQAVNAPSVKETGDDSAVAGTETTATEAAAPPSTELEQTAEKEKTESISVESVTPKQNAIAQVQDKVETEDPADAPKSSEQVKPEELKPTEPPDTEPAATEPPTAPPAATEPVQEPKPAEPEFDIGYWVAYAQNYAESVGLRLESSAVDCWDNPIGANAACIYLERDIKSRLNRYARNEDITDVWIWAESDGDGAYNLYIGYA